VRTIIIHMAYKFADPNKTCICIQHPVPIKPSRSEIHAETMEAAAAHQYRN